MERLFFPFLDAHIQRIIVEFGRFRSAPSPHGAKPLSEEDLFAKQQRLHPFDKRRLHFLRCGRTDIGNLDHRPWKFLNVVLDKSRDERETIIEEMERQLRPREIKSYVYTAFHLQRYFENFVMRNHPAALNEKKVDEAFCDAICRLNEDQHFFEGVPDHHTGSLHPYLQKYLIYYFDAWGFGQHFSWSEFLRATLGAKERTAYQKWRRQHSLSIDEACIRLGIDPRQWETLSREDLTRIYRREAKRKHPDGGGDHEGFITFTEAYEALLEAKLREHHETS